jgi:hypothetical protein
MSAISIQSSTATSNPVRETTLATASLAAPRLQVSGQTASGNSSGPSLQSGNDSAVLSSRASAISSNDNINRVLSDIMGPRVQSGASGAASLQLNTTSSSLAAGDPAAQYRSDKPVPLEGYDQAKLDDPNHKTPKYLFGRVAQGFKLDSVTGDKAKAEELLKAMVPDLKKAGLEVVSVQGDRIQVKTELGYEWVDVIRAAGASDGNHGWQWGSEGKGTPQPTRDFKEFCDLTGAGATASGAASGIAGAAPSGAGGGAAGASAAGGAAPAASGPIATPLGDQIDKSAVMSALQKYKPGNEGLAAGARDLQEKYPGVKVMPHANTQDKLQFPNGAVVDVIVASKTPDAKWGWMPQN